MKPRARLIDVARDAGVSPATVSRAVSQPELLSAQTLARVKASARKLEYLPDGAARALASGRAMTIAALVPTLDSAIFARALQAMQSTLSAAGYQLIVSAHEYNRLAEGNGIRMLLARGIDGLMLVGADRSAEISATLRESNVPVVLTWGADGMFPSVGVDNKLAGLLAVRHLVSMGHQRIGMVCGDIAFNDRQRGRLEGVAAAMTEAGLPFPDWLVSHQAMTVGGGRRGCAALLELKEPPTAVVGGIDLMAIGCIEEAKSRGLRTPEDLSVIGIDGLEMSAHISPALTTVRVPTTQIGEMAATILLAEIHKKPIDQQVILPINLIVRASVARPNEAS